MFVLLFRLEQNVAYVLGLPSARALVGVDALPAEIVVYTFAPFLHVTPDHLVSTLVWFVPFGYLLESRTSWEGYVGYVAFAGYLTTTFVPLVLLLLGVPVGQGVGASGITNALVAREATVRGVWVLQRRSFSWRQRGVVVLVSAVFLLKTFGLVTGEPPGTSVVGHATGLLVGIVAGVSELYLSMGSE
ncbi:rhomboid family intramembrane serine protease [Salinigranum sp. GCM10025319]|uniref:rhomboid family intramembrane serine protease n=1 Tax=Salinigranum sp. GCM10025319 TaxID=3252687 RepID=UPI00360850C0